MMTIVFLVALTVAMAWVALALICLGRSRSARWLRPLDHPRLTEPPKVAAVVPARNEAAHIKQTLECLMGQQDSHLSILVVDDQSVDETAELARQAVSRPQQGHHPVRLLSGKDRPEGWVGKTWALHQGVEATDSEWIWMVDADLWLHPRALATAIEQAEQSGAEFVSFLGRPRCETFWQGAIALALLQILAMLYPLKRVNDPIRTEALAHGAFILIRRSLYDRIGGIASVKGEIVEDIQLASRVKAKGGTIRVAAAPELSQTHMYGSFSAICNGLRKNAFAGMDYQFHKFVTGAILGLVMVWLPVVAVGLGLFGMRVEVPIGPSSLAWLAVGMAGMLGQAVAVMPVIVFLDLPKAFAFSLPAGLPAYLAIASASVWDSLRGRVRWKDRQFSLRNIKGNSIRN